ncbi:MAG: hypothetical protein SPF55_00980, partial [Lentihominibacter sp.]|nr:hypothetical protein [Lentihominibacter sp.]
MANALFFYKKRLNADDDIVSTSIQKVYRALLCIHYYTILVLLVFPLLLQALPPAKNSFDINLH